MEIRKFMHEKSGRTIEVTGPDDMGNYVGVCTSVPGCLGHGSTAHEAFKGSAKSIYPIVEAMRLLGRAVPEIRED